MDEPVIGKHAVEAFRRFYGLLPRSDDASLIILKLHLLVEEQVRAFVDERLRNPEMLRAARLDFHQVICLAESISEETIYPQYWEVARKLNELRNKIAHNLEPSGVIERMRKINSMLNRDPNGPVSPADVLKTFEFTVSSIYLCIAGFVQRRPAEVLQLVQREEKQK